MRGINIKLLVVFSAILFASCDFVVPKDPQVFLQPMRAEPALLSPILAATDGEASKVYDFVYDSLLERDRGTLELKPSLAERWEVSSDHLVLTFHLRKNVKWHDGVPFTADDVVYTFERIVDPKVFDPDLRLYFKDADHIEKVDDYTVKFFWKKPYFRSLEIAGGISPIPKHIFDDRSEFNSHPAHRNPIGTGPFKFVEWKTGRKIVLERNEDYWGKKPGYAGITFQAVGDEAVALQKLKKREFDIGSLTPIQWARQSDTKSINDYFVKARFFVPNFTWIGWNLRKDYFKDKSVRRALSMLINKEAIIDKLMFGQAKITTGPFYVESRGYDKNINPVPYDPEGAAKILDAAGWVDSDGDGIREKDGVKFRFTYMIPSGARIYEQLSSMMREDFGKVGIIVDVTKLEWASFVDRLKKHEFDAVSLVWGLGVDPDMYQIWHSSQSEGGSNFIGYSNPEVDRLIEESRVTFDNEKRYELCKKIHKIIADEQPYVFLFAGASLNVRSKRFVNVIDYPLGWDVREWSVVAQ